MAKKPTKKGNNKPTAKSAPQPQKTVTTVAASSKVKDEKQYSSKLVFRSITSEKDYLWQRLFWGSSGVVLLLTLFLSLGTGK